MPDSMPIRLRWRDLGAPLAEQANGSDIAIDGFAGGLTAADGSSFALLPEANCCPGCLPRHPLSAVEVFTAAPVPQRGQLLRLRGTWRVCGDPPTGWRYQLRQARLVEPPGWSALSRRFVLSGAPLLCLAATDPLPASDERKRLARQAIESTTAIDLHSHAGRIDNVTVISTDAAFGQVAAPMREGGMAAICLAVVSDGPVHRVMADGRIHPYRDPLPGELYAYGQRAFARVHDLARDQGLPIIKTAAALRATRAGAPAVVIAAEGADFLEGQRERIDEAWNRWSLRHLQLTHYRVNELGDIQTEAPVHGGLTDFGAEVIRHCNQLGIVVDVAHGTYDLVKRAVSVTTHPMVLSHTSLAGRPGRFSRQITADHAQLVAATGGVIGVWPPASIYPSLAAMAAGIARLVEVVGIDHVGLGSDMRGLVGPSVLPDYDQLPGLSEALIDVGFSVTDTAKLLGGNYARVFEACVA